MKCPPRPRRWVRRTRRMIVAGAILFAVTQLLYAIGDTGGSQLGQTPPSLSWITLVDGKGINVWQYELGINFKPDIFDPGRTLSAVATEYLWAVYRGAAVIAIWFLDWVFSFDWLTIITAPLIEISNSLRAIISAFGLAPAFLTVAALVGGIFILRGKIARGIYEILVSALVVALGATVLSNPVALVAGTDGWIYQTRDYTMELVAEMGSQAQSDPNAITSQLMTTFIRQPSQLVSFGQILDGTSCEAAYDGALKTGPHGYDDTIRDAVTACNETAGKYAEAPSGGMVSAVLLQSPAGLIVLLIAVLIGGAVMLALVSAILASIKALINLVFAVLPGGARRTLAQSFAEVAVSLATFVFSLFFLTVFLQVVQGIFQASSGEPSKAFLVVNICMVMGLVFFMRFRRKLKASTDRLATWMTTRPGAPAPQPLSSNRGRGAAIAAAGIYGGAKLLSNPRSRQTLKAAGTVGLAAATGNPALAGRVIFTTASKAAAKAPRPGPKAGTVGGAPAGSGSPNADPIGDNQAAQPRQASRNPNPSRRRYRPTNGRRKSASRRPDQKKRSSTAGTTPGRGTSTTTSPTTQRPAPAASDSAPRTADQPSQSAAKPQSRTQPRKRSTKPQAPAPEATSKKKPQPAAPANRASRRAQGGSHGKGHRS